MRVWVTTLCWLYAATCSGRTGTATLRSLVGLEWTAVSRRRSWRQTSTGQTACPLTTPVIDCSGSTRRQFVSSTSLTYLLNVGIDLKELCGGGVDVEMFEILHRDWNLKPIFSQKWVCRRELGLNSQHPGSFNPVLLTFSIVDKSPTRLCFWVGLFHWRSHGGMGLGSTYLPIFWKYGSRNSSKFAYK